MGFANGWYFAVREAQINSKSVETRGNSIETEIGTEYVVINMYLMTWYVHSSNKLTIFVLSWISDYEDKDSYTSAIGETKKIVEEKNCREEERDN